MAEPKSSEKSTTEKAAKPSSSEEEYRYTRESAIAAGRSLTGQSPALVAGALAAEPDKEDFSEAEVQSLTNALVKRDEADADDKSYAPPEPEEPS